MAIELLYADAHITGGFVNPNNALNDTPGTWAGELDTGSSYTSRWAIANPVDPLTSGATQTIRTVARKGSNSGDPTIQLNLYESGTLVSSLTTAVTVTSTTGQTILGTFASSAITNRNNVEIEVVETGTGGNPNTRNSAQISLIEWQAETGAAVPDPKTETLLEDFATEDTGTWTGYDADTTVTGGRLRMLYLSGSNILDTVANYDLSDSSVFAEVYHTEGAGTGASNETFFGVGPAGSIFAGTHYLFDVNITDLYFRIYSGSVADDGAGPITYDPATMRWLRIRHAGGQVHWDTSPDGSTWTNRRSATPAVSVTSLRVKFVAFNFQENQATFAEYDNVNGGGAIGGTGELTAVLPELTGSLTADATTTGSLTGQTPALTASIQGAASVTGDVFAILPKLTASFTTGETIAGTLAVTLPELTGSLAADASGTGTLTGVLPQLTGSFTADAAGGAAPTLDVTLLYNNPSPETDGSGHTTGSVTPAADSLILVCVGTAIALEVAPTVDSITSGFTVDTAWAQVKDHLYSSTGVRRVSVWRAVTGASPGSGTINVTFSGASTSTFVAVVQVTGAGTATPVIQSSSGDGSSNTPSVPLAAAAKGTNRPFAFSTIRSATTHTPRAGWTELLDQSHSAPGMGYEVQWRSDAFDTTADCLAGASANWGIIALEIDAAGAVGGTAELAATLPELTGSLTAEATGTGSLAGVLPELATNLTGQASTEGQLAGTLPEPVAAFTGTASADATLAGTLPKLAGSFTANADTGGATLTAVLPELAGSLTGSASTAGVLAGTLPELTAAIDLAALVDGAMAATLPALEAQFLGTASASAVLTVTLPPFEASLAGTGPVTIEFPLYLPLLVTAIPSLAVTTAYDLATVTELDELAVTTALEDLATSTEVGMPETVTEIPDPAVTTELPALAVITLLEGTNAAP